MPSAEASPSAESPSLTELFSRLPLEVLGLILEEVAEVTRRPKVVAPLCLISKAFLPRIQRKLYYSVSITYKRLELDESGELFDPPQTLRIEEARLYRTLEEAPHLASLVRHLSLILVFDDFTDEDAAEVVPSIAMLLTACRNVLELSVDQDTDWEAAEDVYATIAELDSIPPLEKLDLSHAGPGSISLLTKLPHLRHLSFDQPSTADNLHRYLPKSFPFSLVTLYFMYAPVALFLPLTLNFSATLRELTLESWALTSAAARGGLPDFTALRNLQVYLYSDETQHYQAVASVISSLPALHDLSISSLSIPGPRYHPLATALLPHLPSSLLVLHLQGINPRPTSLIQLFNHRNITPPPDLKLIRLEAAGPGERGALDEDDEDERLLWETVIECCAKAGVEVEHDEW